MTAIISDCGLYRYWLERQVAGAGATVVIMVNPSTADAVEDDHTIRKLKGFGEIHGWGRIIVGNLFAYRTKDVRKLAGVADPVGEDNDYWLSRMLGTGCRVICAWGPRAKMPKALRGRADHVLGMISMSGVPAYRIGAPVADSGPRHPLMAAYTLPIEPL